MSPKLKPLRLPQIVEAARQKEEEARNLMMNSNYVDGENMSQVYYTTTTNSSSSDIASPLTPTFSARHLRHSSSTSSLELSFHLHDPTSSPVQPHHSQYQKSSPQQYQPQSQPIPQQLQYLHQLPQSAIKPSKRSLPDVEEEPFERDDDFTAQTTHFGLYNCLCDGPCEHGTVSSNIFPGDFVTECDIDYDAGFMSDGDLAADGKHPAHRRTSTDAPFQGFTTRLGSRFTGINRWRSTRRPNLVASPTTSINFENVTSHVPSSRSSSISASATDGGKRSYDHGAPSTPATSAYYCNSEMIEIPRSQEDAMQETGKNLERERALATTPLLPPLLTKLNSPPQESPLQSPTIASPALPSEAHTSPAVSTFFPRPSLSSKPSFSSFRFGGNSCDLPHAPPSLVQDHDEWSDRLGHANFTIMPQPYEPELMLPDTLGKFREDWELARCNYTKHLVRTGENYGQTSKIYGLTEAKWAEIDQRWKTSHDNILRQSAGFHLSAPASASHSRSRSRGRGRGRSRAGSATFMRPSAETSPVDLTQHWPRLDDAAPSAITQMLDASDKFPHRGDEDIVGPMVRSEPMLRSTSDDGGKTTKFWKTLVERVGIRK